MAVLGERIASYGDWRRDLVAALRRYAERVADFEPGESAVRAKVGELIERLATERVSIALVAEFSRGKSELINALFFPDSKERIVPSSAGRTTMCPTEIGYESARTGSIRLLPIESRARSESLRELRDFPEIWEQFAIPEGDSETLRAAFAMVQQTRLLSRQDAAALGFGGDDEDEDFVEIPRWRHAIVNFNHPVLAQGLVLIDTPGLNAIGAEPELTLRMIPESDAVVFVLAADTGVTASDLEVWRRYINVHHGLARFVVLNKIDGLWDELRTPGEIDAEIARQADAVAAVLGIENARVFPVSAQKGLVARIQGDAQLLARSRIKRLEAALASELVGRQQEIIANKILREFDAVVAAQRTVLAARRRGAIEQAAELEGLRGRNIGRVPYMQSRIQAERSEFERSLRRLHGVRAVCSKHARAALERMGSRRFQGAAQEARRQVGASHFLPGLRAASIKLFAQLRDDLAAADGIVTEIGTLMGAIYRDFSQDHGIALGLPALMSLRRHRDELDRIEKVHLRHLGALWLVSFGRRELMQRFFETVLSQVDDVRRSAGREFQSWLRAVLGPLEAHVREHQSQLRRRLESIDRVVEAADSLEERIAEIVQLRLAVEQKLEFADQLAAPVRRLLRELATAAEVETA